MNPMEEEEEEVVEETRKKRWSHRERGLGNSEGQESLGQMGGRRGGGLRMRVQGEGVMMERHRVMGRESGKERLYQETMSITEGPGLGTTAGGARALALARR